MLIFGNLVKLGEVLRAGTLTDLDPDDPQG